MSGHAHVISTLITDQWHAVFFLMVLPKLPTPHGVKFRANGDSITELQTELHKLMPVSKRSNFQGGGASLKWVYEKNRMSIYLIAPSYGLC